MQQWDIRNADSDISPRYGMGLKHECENNGLSVRNIHAYSYDDISQLIGSGYATFPIRIATYFSDASSGTAMTNKYNAYGTLRMDFKIWIFCISYIYLSLP